MSLSSDKIVVTGLGVVSAIGRGVAAFAEGLRKGLCGIQRFSSTPPVVGAFLPNFSAPAYLEEIAREEVSLRHRARRVMRQASDSAHVTIAAAVEAWISAGLDRSPAADGRLGVVCGGNNVSMRYLAAAWSKLQSTAAFLSPRHAFLSLDTNLVGAISEILGVQGCGLTTGGASASGNVAVWNAKHLLQSGAADCLLVAGASPELSSLELQAFGIIGAAAPDAPNIPPDNLYRPFDRSTLGFVPGEGSACVVLETESSAIKRGATIWATLAAASLVLHGSHLPTADTAGEVRAMRLALEDARLDPTQIDYVNAHGSGSNQGDPCECEAIAQVFEPARPWVNSTKSLTGHCLSAAGLVELAAALVQMRDNFVHPNRNLTEPIDARLRFVGAEAVSTLVRSVLSNSFGFGGFNSSIILRRSDDTLNALGRTV